MTEQRKELVEACSAFAVTPSDDNARRVAEAVLDLPITDPAWEFEIFKVTA